MVVKSLNSLSINDVLCQHVIYVDLETNKTREKNKREKKKEKKRKEKPQGPPTSREEELILSYKEQGAQKDTSANGG